MTTTRAIKILLVDPDPIFRLGLRVALEAQANLEIVGEAQTDVEALQLVSLMQSNQNPLDLIILELINYPIVNQLCRQLKTQYPTLPILLLTQPQQQLASLAQIGVEGFCPKGSSISELVTAINTVTSGGVYWFDRDTAPYYQDIYSPPPTLITRTGRLLNNLRLSGNNYIQANLRQIRRELQVPGVPTLERAVLAGKVRELLAARWLLNHLLSVSPQEERIETNNLTQLSTSSQISVQEAPQLSSPRSLQSDLFASCVSQLQLPLQNVSDVALEIEILRVEKKRELLYLVLQKLAEVLDDLRNSQVEIHQLYELKYIILRDLWQIVTTEFFGKFTSVRDGNNNIQIVNLFLQDINIVQSEILNKIPLFSELLSYLIFQNDWYIDNAIYTADSTEARASALMILENVLIQIANSVIQPLLNRLADVESIKKDYYDRQFISTREIERFRNNLSWKYRLINYYNEPQAIFESRYEIFVFAPRGIAKTSIYASRRDELTQLRGIPLFVTLILEFRDAVAPRLQSLLSFLGSGVVFVLTQVVGRGLGLIGRGILQGIGSVSFLEGKNKKP
ncbi:response regulator receiver protein [Calothrix sp. NIES-4071]|nr:response regulator receiver protein [Calothrix sp. NIES-4071]BAZ57701.1 response regulator receiver protein [Calothrix sp. NIES-4105]